MTTFASGDSLCAGRFVIRQPQGLTLAGRSQRVYLTDVNVIPPPPGGLDQYWKDRLPKISQVLPRDFAPVPGVKGVWSSRNRTFRDLLTLEAVKTVDAGLLVMAASADKGKEELAERLVTALAGSYVPSNAQGFCLEQGALTLGQSVNEQVHVTFKDADAPELELLFETQTVRQPDLKTYSNLNEERSVMVARGGTLTVLRDDNRSVAGFVGKELWVRAAASGEKQIVSFSWHYPGVGGSSVQPSINVVGTGYVEHEEKLKTSWESLLTSLRPVPPARSR